MAARPKISAKSKGAKMIVRPKMDLRMTMEMIDERNELPLRAAAIRRYLMYTAAQETLEAVTAKIPNKPEFSAYRQALRVVQSGLPSNPVFSVIAEGKEEPVIVATDVLYFKPKKIRGRIDPVVGVLMQHQPWTTDTLPFEPSRKFADLVSRRVTRDEVNRVRKAREETRSEWTQQLQKLGIQPKPKTEDEQAQTKAVSDLTFMALRLEYGLGRTKAVAHWRPAIRSVKKRVEEMFASKKIASAMMNWKDNEWRKWRSLGADVVSSTDLDGIEKFQRKESE